MKRLYITANVNTDIPFKREP